MTHLLTIPAVFFLFSCKGQNRTIYGDTTGLNLKINGDTVIYDGHILWDYSKLDSSGMLNMEIAYFDDKGNTILSKDKQGHYTFCGWAAFRTML